MDKLERLFNGLEISMLRYALSCGMNELKRDIEFFKNCDADRDLFEECVECLDILKSLYRRFYPHLTDEHLFGIGGEADEK